MSSPHGKKAVVIHSGGMDSSLCLALAIREFGSQAVLSLSFDYGQRHSPEIECAKKICADWEVDHLTVSIDCLRQLTDNALMNSLIPISHEQGKAANTLVVGRNGLMARLGAIYAHRLGAHFIYMGLIEVEALRSGYRDHTRTYMDKMEEILRIDLDDPLFEIRTPIFSLTKKDSMVLGERLGILSYLLENTITCYQGIPRQGCQECPSCQLRNEGIREWERMKEEG